MSYLLSIWSWRMQTLHLFLRPVSWVPGARAAWDTASREYPRLCKNNGSFLVWTSQPSHEGDRGSTVLQRKKLRHGLETRLTCLERDSQSKDGTRTHICKLQPDVFATKHKLFARIFTSVPNHTTTHCITYPLQISFFSTDSFRLAYVFN